MLHPRALLLPSLAAVLGAGLASLGAAQQASFVPLPGVLSANDLTPDGAVVVGDAPSGAYTWRWQTDPQPTLIGGLSAVAVSDDGSVIAGNVVDPISGNATAGIWTEATGWQSLGALPGAPSGCGGGTSAAYDISGDGSIVVGLSWANGTCLGRAFRWTQATGMEQLEVLGNDRNRATTISRDGSSIGGFAQGTFARTPATWSSDLTGQLYDIDAIGEVFGLNADGSIAVGTYQSDGFYRASGGPITALPELVPGWTGYAEDLVDDGSLIVGFDGFSLSRVAWIWSPADGIRSMQERLAGLGVEGVPSLEVCRAISDDGTIVCGHNFGSAWLAVLPPEPVATPYGCGLNPEGSLQVLSGEPAIGTSITLGVDNPLGTQPAGGSLALLSFSTQPAPGFPCGLALPGLGMSAPGANGELLIGVVPPNPVLTLVGPIWNGAGNPAPIALFLPNDPTLLGLALYAQGILWDFTGTSGIDFGLTDAIELRLGS